MTSIPVDGWAEPFAEIARFWAGLGPLTVAAATSDRVIGPLDEFHSGHPGNEYDGIGNNAYTNVMAVWVILRAMEALGPPTSDDRRHLTEKLGLTTQESVNQWDDTTHVRSIPRRR